MFFGKYSIDNICLSPAARKQSFLFFYILFGFFLIQKLNFEKCKKGPKNPKTSQNVQKCPKMPQTPQKNPQKPNNRHALNRKFHKNCFHTTKNRPLNTENRPSHCKNRQNSQKNAKTSHPRRPGNSLFNVFPPP